MNETSNWEFTKKTSQYHFDTSVLDPRWDKLRGIGRLEGNWSKELTEVIKSAEPATWRTRLKTKRYTLSPVIEQEEQDLIDANCDPNIVLLRMLHEDKIPKKFLDMAELFGISMPKIRVHVQFPGEVFTQHIDKLAAFSAMPRTSDAQAIRRIVVFLTDWVPGHFYQFGNESVQGWRAGDIHTFDWMHVPHSTANAGITPRVTLQITGRESLVTKAFINEALNTASIKI